MLQYLINNFIICFLQKMIKFAVKEWAELISDPISFGERDQRVFKHSELPTVNNKLSVTLRLKIRSHGSSWAAIFRKSKLIKFFFRKDFVNEIIF